MRSSERSRVSVMRLEIVCTTTRSPSSSPRSRSRRRWVDIFRCTDDELGANVELTSLFALLDASPSSMWKAFTEHQSTMKNSKLPLMPDRLDHILPLLLENVPTPTIPMPTFRLNLHSGKPSLVLPSDL